MKTTIVKIISFITLFTISSFMITAHSQSKDALFEKAYSLWLSRDAAEVQEANTIFMNLAQDGYAKAYSYAALSYMNDDIDSFEFYGDLALDNEDNWIGKQLGNHYYKTGQFIKAARAYEKALNSAWRSDVALSLGKMYEEGEGVTKDIERAKELYKISIQSARGGFVEHSEAYRRYKALGGQSLYDKAKFYEAEGNVDKSLTAEELFEKGEDLLDGFVTTKNPYKGYAYIKAAADKGNPEAMAKLSEIYISSIYGINDADASKVYAELAVKTYQKLAHEGDGDACCELGNCYKRGYLTEVNKELSRKYYLRGARLGHWHCLRYCGEMFEADGDYQQAISYYKKAVAKNEMMAAYYLANMYLEGKGTPKDKDKAIELYKACAKAHWICKQDAIDKLRSLGIDTSQYNDDF